MGVPHITAFCWCFGLETGTKIIAVLHLAAALTLLVLSALFAEGARGLAGTVEDGEDRLYSTWYGISVTVAVVSAAHVLLAATLLFAACKRNTVALRAWVWLMLALAGAALAFVLVGMTFGFSASGSEIFLAFLEGILFFGVLAYCILCVNSYYLMLKSSEDLETPNKVDY